MGTSAETAGSDVAAGAEHCGPDWDLVPFEVGCARCGHDLRGLSEPKCPACGLTFDWSQAVPIEELTCGKCGYHLYGLRETRCPECGAGFTWESVLDDYHRRRKPLFEYHWRERPVGSFVGTWFRALRPGRFGRMVELHDPVRVGPLLVMVAVFLAVSVSVLVVFNAGASWLVDWSWARNNPRWAWQKPGLDAVPRYVLRSLRSDEPYYLAWTVCLWFGFSFGALLVFQQSMRRCRVRIGHVVRAWALSLPLVVPVIVTFVMCWICADAARDNYFGEERYLFVGSLCTLAFGTYALWCAYRRYLRIPHSVAVVLSAQAIAVMATTLGELGTLPSVRYAVSMTILEGLGLL